MKSIEEVELQLDHICITATVTINEFENSHFCSQAGTRYFDDAEVTDVKIDKVINSENEEVPLSEADEYIEQIKEVALRQAGFV